MIQSYELKVPWVAMATRRYFLPRLTCSHGCLSLGDGDQPLLPEGEKEECLTGGVTDHIQFDWDEIMTKAIVTSTELVTYSMAAIVNFCQI